VSANPDRCDLQREALDHGGKGGHERCGEREACCGAAAACGTRKQHGPSWADFARAVPGDLEWQQEMGVDVAACRV